MRLLATLMFGLLLSGCGSPSVAPTSDLTPGWRATVQIGDAGPCSLDRLGFCLPPTAKVALDGSGQGFAVWERLQPNAVVGSIFVPGAEWTTASPISDTFDFPNTAHPDLAVNGGGAAVVVWSQCSSDSTCWSTRANRYLPGGWGSPEN